MMKSNGKRNEVEKLLLIEYDKKGYLLEDEIIDTCVEFDLDLIEIDALCEKLLSQKIVVRDSISDGIGVFPADEAIVDRSHLDYDELLSRMQREIPNCGSLIDSIKCIIPPQSKEWKILIEEAQTGNAYAKNRMILMYLRTVLKLAYDFSKANYCDFEDTFQNGVLGLIKAIEKFDVTSPDGFPAYFQLWVVNYMRRHSVVQGSIMRYPMHFKEKLNVIVSKACDLMIDDDFEEALELVCDGSLKSGYLVAGVQKEYVLPYAEIPDDYCAETDSFSAVYDDELKGILGDILNRLGDRERKVIALRYGLNGMKVHTLEEVGSIFHVTRERVRQIEAKAIKKISNSQRIHELDAYLW